MRQRRLFQSSCCCSSGNAECGKKSVERRVRAPAPTVPVVVLMFVRQCGMWEEECGKKSVERRVWKEECGQRAWEEECGRKRMVAHFGNCESARFRVPLKSVTLVQRSPAFSGAFHAWMVRRAGCSNALQSTVGASVQSMPVNTLTS